MGEYADDAIDRCLTEWEAALDREYDDPDTEPNPGYMAAAFGVSRAFVPIPGFNKDPEKCRRCFGVVDHGRMVHAVDCKT